jgi:hypothetical protein
VERINLKSVLTEEMVVHGDIVPNAKYVLRVSIIKESNNGEAGIKTR